MGNPISTIKRLVRLRRIAVRQSRVKNRAYLHQIFWLSEVSCLHYI